MGELCAPPTAVTRGSGNIFPRYSIPVFALIRRALKVASVSNLFLLISPLHADSRTVVPGFLSKTTKYDDNISFPEHVPEICWRVFMRMRA